jgi:hypothetical protein
MSSFNFYMKTKQMKHEIQYFHEDIRISYALMKHE